jgi:hypothetical protein
MNNHHVSYLLSLHHVKPVLPVLVDSTPRTLSSNLVWAERPLPLSSLLSNCFLPLRHRSYEALTVASWHPHFADKYIICSPLSLFVQPHSHTCKTADHRITSNLTYSTHHAVYAHPTPCGDLLPRLHRCLSPRSSCREHYRPTRGPRGELAPTRLRHCQRKALLAPVVGPYRRPCPDVR